MKYRSTFNVLALASLIGLSLSAFAEDQITSKKTSKTVVSFGVLYKPEYQGASQYRALPVLFTDYQNVNGLFASNARGIGYGTQFEGVDVSAAVGYRIGRSEDQKGFYIGSGEPKGMVDVDGSDDLKGMGDIKNSFTTLLHVGAHLGDLIKVSLDSELALSQRDNGNKYTLGLSLPVLQFRQDQLEFRMETTFGDDKFNQKYFGVSQQQSQHSGYTAFQPHSGFTQATAGIVCTHGINTKWSIRNYTGVTQALDDAANSPLTQNKTDYFLMTTANYSF